MSAAASCDVLVVGGGPVGLAVAIAARRAGLAVRVIDARRPPIDKACGEGLMPDGAARLEELGVRLPAGRFASFRGIRYLDGETRAEARFALGRGLGIRRPVLQAALLQRAAELGVEPEWGRRAVGLGTGGVETERGPITARWVVGADGLHSGVRRWASLEGRARGRRRFGVRRHFELEPWTDLVEVHWAERCEAYVTPVSPREVGVAMLWSGEKSRFDRLLERFPALARRLASSRVVSEDRGAGPLRQRARAVVSGPVALVGDAAGYLDAITGEGLALGFHQAAALVEAIEAGDLRLYAHRFRRLVALPFALIRALLFAERHPPLRRRMIRTLAREPELFARLLAIHAGEEPASSLGLGGTLRLVYGLARG